MAMRLIGANRLTKKLSKLPIEATKALRDEISRGAIALQNEMRRSIQKGSKTGVTYRRGSMKGGKAFKFHRASAKGEAPATDSGRLVSHINFFITNRGLLAKVGVTDLATVRYARRLELGGRDKRGVYIAPRPYVRPALRKHGKRILRRIRTAIAKVTKRVG